MLNCHTNQACLRGTISCASHRACNVSCIGDHSCTRSSINRNGGIGTKLHLMASGNYALDTADIYCPEDKLRGEAFSANGSCTIIVDGHNGQNTNVADYLSIYAMDAFNGLTYQCINAPFAPTYSPCNTNGHVVLVCGMDAFDGSCAIQPVFTDTNGIQSEWECVDSSHPCQRLVPTQSPTTTRLWIRDPTADPSSYPTTSPTFRPTNADLYDSYFNIEFMMINLDNMQITKMVEDSIDTTNDIAQLIETAYVEETSLPYHVFWLQIKHLNGFEIQNIGDDYLGKFLNANITMNCAMRCAAANCENLLYLEQNEFEENVEMKLNEYFDANENVQTIEFVVESNLESIKIMELYPVDAIDYVFWGLTGLTVMMILFVPFAFMFNKDKLCKLPGCHTVDDGKWAALMSFALQFYDFGSDVNLVINTWIYTGNVSNKSLFTIAKYGCTAFVIIPYCVNLLIAAKIKRFVDGNPCAQAYFETKSAIFVAMVMVTGGAYPALAMVSSNIFGLEILSSGITTYELKRFAALKVIGTVVLELSLFIFFDDG